MTIRVPIGDTDLAVDLAGPEGGPPIVLLHSVGLSTREGWRAQVPVLAGAGFRVVTFDFRGLGQSAKGSRACTVETFVEDLAALMDRLDIGRVAVMGVSLGGFVAQAFVLAYPERVRALVLVSTACRIAAGNTGARAERNRRIRAEGMEVAAGPQIDSHFAEGFCTAHPEVMEWYRRHYLANDPETYAAIMENLGTFDACARLGEIGCPTLVVTGGEDVSNVAGGVPGRAAKVIAGTIPSARLEIVAGAHHYPHIECADAFNAVMMEFLMAQNS